LCPRRFRFLSCAGSSPIYSAFECLAPLDEDPRHFIAAFSAAIVAGINIHLAPLELGIAPGLAQAQTASDCVIGKDLTA